MISTAEGLGVRKISGEQKLRMNKFRTILWVFSILILIQALLPINNPENKLNHIYLFSFRADYLIHMSLLICWMTLYYLAFFRHTSFTVRRLFLFLGPGIIMAVCSECIQLFIKYRTFSMNDMIANLTGVVLSLPLIIVVQVLVRDK